MAPFGVHLGRFIPGPIKRLQADRDAAFVEAAREAYRAAASEAARYLEVGDGVEERPADKRPAPSSTLEDALAEVGAHASEAQPAAPPWSWAPRRPDQPGSEPSAVPSRAARPSAAAVARATRPQAGEVPLDHLLRVPESVDAAADDFFDGLTRRVEGHR